MKAWLALIVGFWTVVGSTQEASLTVPLIDPGTGTYYVQSNIADTLSTRMLVDTGSSYSTLSEAMLHRLLQEDEDSVVYIRSQQGILANGQQISVPLYRIKRLRIGDHCVLEDVEMAVFPRSRRAILGLNVLAQLSPFSISVDPPEIHLSGCQRLETRKQHKPSLAAAP